MFMIEMVLLFSLINLLVITLYSRIIGSFYYCMHRPVQECPNISTFKQQQQIFKRHCQQYDYTLPIKCCCPILVASVFATYFILLLLKHRPSILNSTMLNDGNTVHDDDLPHAKKGKAVSVSKYWM